MRTPRGSQIVVILALLGMLVSASILTPAAAATRERILQFDSEIWIHRDSSMTVRETIAVEAAGREIRRGIYRDFPTIYKDKRGTRIVAGFDVEKVTRDGKPETYHTERRSNGTRLYIGSKDVRIPTGRHVYTITYRTTRQLGFFDGFDELYWNVTGNEWAFPIEHARSIFHLPEGARVRDSSGYTGPQGAQGRDFTYTPLVDGVVRFETTRPLAPGEGLTVAVSWPAGFVERPSGAKKFLYFLRDNSVVVAGIVGLGFLLLYYIYFWRRVGRDPEKGVVVTQYAPPGTLSPAGARYVMRFGFDDKVFTAAIVNMAVKGYLTIQEDEDKVFTLAMTGKSPPLTPGENAVARKLFPHGRGGVIELKQKNHARLQAAQTALKAKLRNEYEKTHFVRNTRYFIPGVLLSVAALVVLALAADEPVIAGFLTVWLAGWTVGVYFLATQLLRAWRTLFAAGGIANFVRAIVITVFALPFFGGEVAGLAFYASVASIAGAFMLLAMQGVNVVFYHLLKAPTLLGRRLMDRVEGFKQYLSVAEQDRMNMLNPPERTPELFEKFLPYALALDVEQEWAEQFSGVLAQAATDPNSGTHHYRPHWYSGRGLNHGLSGFGSALGGAFSGAIASASTSPGSSCGSGGGGSSGGGGGGGGGGGW